MAGKKTVKKTAKSTKAVAEATAKPVKEKKVKAPKEPKPLSPRQVAFQEKHAPVCALAKGVKTMEHNHGLYWIQMGKNSYVVGAPSSTGKSFTVEFSGDHDASYEFYKTNRSGKYGAAAEGGAAPKASKASKTAKSGKKSKPPVVNDDDEIEDLLD
jgi:hypothetical protein